VVEIMNLFTVNPGRLKDLLSGSPGSRKALLFLLAVLLSWSFFWIFQGKALETEGRLDLKKNRFGEFLQVVREYRQISGQSSSKEAAVAEGGPIQIISDLLGRLEIRDRLVQMSMTGSGITLQLRNLYVEDMANLVENLENSGLIIESAQIRALQGNEGRVFDISLIVVS